MLSCAMKPCSRLLQLMYVCGNGFSFLMAYWCVLDFPFPTQNSELRSIAAVKSVVIPIDTGLFVYHPEVFASDIRDTVDPRERSPSILAMGS